MNILTCNKKAVLRLGFLFAFILAASPYALTPVFAAFEDTETGPRAAAMAGAFAAQSDDVSSVFYNPAGLTGLRRYEFMVSHETLFTGLSDGSSLAREAFALGVPVCFKKRCWGSAAFGYDILKLSGGLYSEGRMKLGYSYPVVKNIWAGVSAARLSVAYGSDEYTAVNPVLAQADGKSGMSFDVGLLVRLAALDIGLAVRNANEPDMGLKYENKVDRKIDLGLSLRREAFTWNAVFVSAGKDMRIKTGAETFLLREKLKERFLARGGLSLGSRDYRNAALGFGFRSGSYRVDYSFVYPLSGIADTMGSHQLGLSLAWGRPRGEEEEEADKEKRKPGEGGAGGEGAPMVLPMEERVVTPEDRAQAQKLLDQAKRNMEKGDYRGALEALVQADVLLRVDQDVKKSVDKMTIIVGIVPKVNPGNTKGYLVNELVAKYMAGHPDAVFYAAYIHQKWPKDSYAARLYDIVVKEFPAAAAETRLLPGITIVDQLVQEALDSIRNGRFIQAVSTLERVLQVEPNNTVALIRMGSAYWAMDKRDMARKTWQRVLEIDPKNTEVREFMKIK